MPSRDSSKATERVIQFETEAKPSKSSGKEDAHGFSNVNADTLLRLKNANARDLIAAITDMKDRPLSKEDSDRAGTELHYNDFALTAEKHKLTKMVDHYDSVVKTIQNSPFRPLATNAGVVKQGGTKTDQKFRDNHSKLSPMKNQQNYQLPTV